MDENSVRDWFGAAFLELHPLLQQLHRHGGILSGAIDVEIPGGLAGFAGRALAKRLGVPTDGARHELSVTISHEADGLHWDRCFDGRTIMRSLFVPVGQRPTGYWVESTGPLKMDLTVDIVDGGWYWRCLRLTVKGLRLPVWLFPKSRAYKRIEDGNYRFYVGFSVPLLGTVLSYSGLLQPAPTNEPRS
jgi:hypothetical protein